MTEKELREQYEIFSDIWRIYKKYCISMPVSWNDITVELDGFFRKYENDLAKDLSNAILGDLGRKEKEWKDQLV